jgi:hypothetical protein
LAKKLVWTQKHEERSKEAIFHEELHVDTLGSSYMLNS